MYTCVCVTPEDTFLSVLNACVYSKCMHIFDGHMHDKTSKIQHAHICRRMFVCVLERVQVHMHTTNTNISRKYHTHTCTHTPTHAHTHSHPRIHAHTNTITSKHTHAGMHIHTNIDTDTDTDTDTDAVKTQAQTQTQTKTHEIRFRRGVLQRMLRLEHTHTHTHTHTQDSTAQGIVHRGLIPTVYLIRICRYSKQKRNGKHATLFTRHVLCITLYMHVNVCKHVCEWVGTWVRDRCVGERRCV